jgi:hypothetical protein
MQQVTNFSTNISLILETCKITSNATKINTLITQVTDWDAFINLAYIHGVLPLIYRTLKRYAELIPQEILLKLKLYNMNIVKQNIIMTSELMKVMKLLEDNGIHVLTFKGPVLSYMAYADITLRQYADIDILVDEALLFEAATLLAQSGYTYPSPISLLKDKNFLALNNDFNFFTSNKIHIEIHWKLIREKIGKNRKFQTYLDDHISVEVNKHSFNTLSLEMLLVYLCLHGSKHAWERIEWINDVYILISNTTLDWAKVMDITKIMECKLSLFLGLNLSKQLYNLALPQNIEKMIDTDYVSGLTQNVFDFLQDDIVSKEDYGKYQKVNLFQLKLLDTKVKQIKHLWVTYVAITRTDYLAMSLPSYLHILYYIIKPFRVLYKFFVKGK